MSVGELAGGIALVALPGIAAAWLAWRVVAGRLGHLQGEQRVVAVALVWMCALLGIHLVPLLLGVLSQASVLVCSALVALAGVAARPVAGRGDPAPRESPEPSLAGWVLAAAGVVVVAIAAIASLRAALPVTFYNVDAIGGNLPQAARWIESGSLWQIDEYVPLQAHGTYPGNGMLLITWAMLPLENDVLVRLVIAPLLLWFAVAAFALARELGARPTSAVLAATALVASPIVAEASIEHAFPDVLLYAAMTSGALFLVRHLRTGRASDLILAGLGIGVGLGTKWYGATVAAVLVACWLGARLLSRGRPKLPALLRDGTVVCGVALLGGGAWLLRNLVEVGNPIFPVKVGAFGITLFDAEPDVVRDSIGFSVADYAGDPDVLLDHVLPDVVSGLGVLVVLGLAGAVLAAVLAWRHDRRIVAVAGIALALGLVYSVTPYTALGEEGEPILTRSNARYAVPALIGLACCAAWLAGRRRGQWLVEALLLACVLAAVPSAFDPLRAKGLVVAALALGLLAAAVAGVRFLAGPHRRLAAVAACAVAALAGLAYLDRTEERFNAKRYASFDPAFAVLQDAPGMRVGLTGLWSLDGLAPVWPAFGSRMQHDVRYVGHEDEGWLRAFEDRTQFTGAVRDDGLDALIVGRGFVPGGRPAEEAYAKAAGMVEVSRSERLVLFARPELARFVPRQDAVAPGG